MANDHPLLKNRIIYFLITAFFVVGTATCVLFFLINVRIKTVTLENCVYSESSAVLEAASIKKGTHSYAIDKTKISEAIMAANPYVTDVRIKRTGISTVALILTEDEPRFYIERGGKYLVLSGTLRVLARYESLDECAHLSVHPISLVPIAEAELGETVVFAEGYEEKGKESIDLLSQISESELSGTITYADLSERFDLRFTYKDKYEIRFGAPRSFEEKLALVVKTVAFLENPENSYSTAKGIIHASVPGETSFEPTGSTEEAQKIFPTAEPK
ncbi:MAG: FtsQ-type POTRA domain-containing protein [Clostridia bacterium]|nr:FtsQ-type POTRA domain-containing protein [Clostridia bacterium]